MSKISIKFIHGWNTYVVGDIAGFPEPYANDLVKKGYAVRLDGKAIPAAPNTKHIDGPGQVKEIRETLERVTKKPIEQARELPDETLDLSTGELETKSNTYFCELCKHYHKAKSKIGKEHAL